MALTDYRQKRDPAKTTEPFNGETSLPHPIYAIQEHHASRLHWDLRLEFDGVLRSWALPKEPPTEEGIKRLAVEVEDHPLSYAAFQGEIPKGEYGAGTVKLWDNGTFEALEQEKDKILLRLIGKKLNGTYALVRTRMGGNEKNWLMFKKKTTA